MPSKSEASIGIFDSGFGGLSVMRAIRHVLPMKISSTLAIPPAFPMEAKAPETIVRYSLESAAFLIDQGVKLLVVACNTVCAVALDQLQQTCPIPVVGVIQSGIEQVVKTSQTGCIAILGTRATIASGVYQQQIQADFPMPIFRRFPVPLFVPLVEEGYGEHPLTELVIQEYLHPLRLKAVDTVLLGCTHYPLMQAIIQKSLGAQVTLVDPAPACAEHVRLLLEKAELLNQQTTLPHYQFYVSDDPEKFRLLGKTFLNYPIEHVVLKPV